MNSISKYGRCVWRRGGIGSHQLVLKKFNLILKMGGLASKICPDKSNTTWKNNNWKNNKSDTTWNKSNTTWKNNKSAPIPQPELQPQYCTSCGAESFPTDRFCGQCGKELRMRQRYKGSFTEWLYYSRKKITEKY